MPGHPSSREGLRAFYLSLCYMFRVQVSSIHTDRHLVTRGITGSPVAQGKEACLLPSIVCLLYGNHPSTRIDTGSTGISPGHPSCRESKPAFCHIPKEEGRMRAAVSKGLHWISISSSTSESPWRWRCTSRNLGLPPHCPGLSFSHLLTVQAHNQGLNSPFSELEFQISEKMGSKIVDVSGLRMLKYLSS